MPLWSTIAPCELSEFMLAIKQTRTVIGCALMWQSMAGLGSRCIVWMTPLLRMQRVARDHLFELGPEGNFGTVPLGVFGVVLVHFWARSFRDCLIKVFCNRFVDAKSADQSQALALIRQGALPVRLRLLAYFNLHLGYLLTGLQEAPQFDWALEEVLLRGVISEDDEFFVIQP